MCGNCGCNSAVANSIDVGSSVVKLAGFSYRQTPGEKEPRYWYRNDRVEGDWQELDFCFVPSSVLRDLNRIAA